MVPAVEVDLLPIESTPLLLLASILAVAAVAAVVIILLTTVAGTRVDRRWPSDEPLSPVELLWGEAGGHVQRAFHGLDLDLAKDLATRFRIERAPAGAVIAEQGEPPTHYYVLQKGEAETGDGARLGPGDSIGEAALVRGLGYPASVRATRDCTLLALPAEDYIAGAALAAAEDHELDLPAGTVARGGSTGLVANRAWRPTHEVPGEGLPLWSEPDPDAPASGSLTSGVEVEVVERRGGWARVRTAAGMEGWMNAEALDEGRRS